MHFLCGQLDGRTSAVVRYGVYKLLVGASLGGRIPFISGLMFSTTQDVAAAGFAQGLTDEGSRCVALVLIRVTSWLMVS